MFQKRISGKFLCINTKILRHKQEKKLQCIKILCKHTKKLFINKNFACKHTKKSSNNMYKKFLYKTFRAFSMKNEQKWTKNEQKTSLHHNFLCIITKILWSSRKKIVAHNNFLSQSRKIFHHQPEKKSFESVQKSFWQLFQSENSSRRCRNLFWLRLQFVERTFSQLERSQKSFCSDHKKIFQHHKKIFVHTHKKFSA